MLLQLVLYKPLFQLLHRSVLLLCGVGPCLAINLPLLFHGLVLELRDCTLFVSQRLLQNINFSLQVDHLDDWFVVGIIVVVGGGGLAVAVVFFFIVSRNPLLFTTVSYMIIKIRECSAVQWEMEVR